MAGSNPVSVGIESIRYVSSNRSRTARWPDWRWGSCSFLHRS